MTLLSVFMELVSQDDSDSLNYYLLKELMVRRAETILPNERETSFPLFKSETEGRREHSSDSIETNMREEREGEA